MMHEPHVLVSELYIWTSRVMNIKVFRWSFIFTGFDQQWNVIIIIDCGLCEIELLFCCQRSPYCAKLSIISGVALAFEVIQRNHKACNYDCIYLNLLIELLCNQASFSIVSINSKQICSENFHVGISTNEQEKFTTLHEVFAPTDSFLVC